MFSHVMKVNYPANPGKFARIAQILGEDTSGLPIEEAAGRSVGAVERLCRDCGVPTRLSEVDVPAHVIPELAEAAFTTQQRLLGFNPKGLSLEDIEKIYRAAA
jgi:alcohol dehydrogenase class IV